MDPLRHYRQLPGALLSGDLPSIVRKALEGLDAEIIVVDNHSGDGSVDLLRPLFPEVNWIVNTGK